VLRIREFYSRIPDAIFSIPDPGSRVVKIPDPGSGFAPKNPKKTYTKFSKMRSGMFIPDPKPWLWIFLHPRFRIRILDFPEVKKHRIPGPGSATLDYTQ
jgi:hypothetical protein